MKTGFLLNLISPDIHETLVIYREGLILMPTGSYVSIGDSMHEVNYTAYDPTTGEASVHCKNYSTTSEEAAELIKLARFADWLPMSEYIDLQA